LTYEGHYYIYFLLRQPMEKYSLWLWEKPGKHSELFFSYFVVTLVGCSGVRSVEFKSLRLSFP